MKQSFLVIALLMILFSCGGEKTSAPVRAPLNPATAPLSDVLPGETLEEVGTPKLGEGAERYFGEYVSQENEQARIVVKKHPTKEGMIAKRAFIANYKPTMSSYWYDEKTDQLSNHFVKIQPKFSIMKLSKEGDRLTQITIDLEADQSDTTLYTKIQ